MTAHHSEEHPRFTARIIYQKGDTELGSGLAISHSRERAAPRLDEGSVIHTAFPESSAEVIDQMSLRSGVICRLVRCLAPAQTSAAKRARGNERLAGRGTCSSARSRVATTLCRSNPYFNTQFAQGSLSPPSALGSSLLLPRPWAALLRLLLQQKVPVRTLRKLAGPVVAEEEASLEDVIWACLPKIAKDIWLQSPHRMYSAEAEVCPSVCPSPHNLG